MRLENLPSEFQEALPILKKIKSAGYQAYFVGGSVRDAFLGRSIHDVDIATSSYPQETKAIFDKTIDVGIEHGTVLVLTEEGEYEITTFRTEDTYVDYRRPSQVQFVRSLEEDLKRRDFTINALALSEDAEVVDLFNGLEDLEAGLLRAVGVAQERFEEDALRIMRGFRFQSTLGFDLEEQTERAMAVCSPLLSKISVERIFIEFDKLLLGANWQKALDSLLASKAYLYLPDLENQASALSQLGTYYPVNYKFGSSIAAWSAMLISIGPIQVSSFLKKWKTSNEFSKAVSSVVELYQIRLERAYHRRDIYFYDKELLKIAEELRRARGLTVDFDQIDQLDSQLSIHSKQDMAISGSILIQKYGFESGPRLGSVLKKVELALVDGLLENQEDKIIDFIGDINE